jgi:hypothetical protein
MSYTCRDREINQHLRVQDGWIEVDVVAPTGVDRITVPLVRQIDNVFAGRPPCGHDKRATDPRCNGCSLQ